MTPMDGVRSEAVTGDTTFYLRGPGGELLTEWHDLGATARARDYVYAGTRLIRCRRQARDIDRMRRRGYPQRLANVA